MMVKRPILNKFEARREWCPFADFPYPANEWASVQTLSIKHTDAIAIRDNYFYTIRFNRRNFL
ncbi:hypothetical protein [Hahella sp. CCB-MM4]|uniref:hypothetical protein n=1 Tax=Hahella sp. (strain CCB-MM4) TaxID=1926491 RepID=UPI001FEED5E0|nr:hypothetical protein [Hahella sp. CCB-MM4]